MSETADQSQVAGVVDDSAVGSLTVDASASTSGDDEFISPRTRIMEAKSSEEELTVSKTRVQARTMWIEQTLLKDQKPLSENTQRLPSKSRQSLPASTSSVGRPHTLAKPRTSLGSSNDDVLARARAAIDGRTKSRAAAKEKVRAAMASMGDEGEDSSVSLATSSLKENESDDTGAASTSYAWAAKKDADVDAKSDRPLIEKQSVVNNSDSVLAKRAKATQDAKDIRAKARERLNATMALLNDTPERVRKESFGTTESDVPAVASSSYEEASPDWQLAAEAEKKDLKMAADSDKQPDLVRPETESNEQESALAKLRQKCDSRGGTEQKQAELSFETGNALMKMRNKAEVKRRLAEGMAKAEHPVQQTHVGEEQKQDNRDRELGQELSEANKRMDSERALAEQRASEEAEAKHLEELQEELEQENALAEQLRVDKMETQRREEVERIAAAALKTLDVKQTTDDVVDVAGKFAAELEFEAIASCSTAGTPALADKPSETSDATSFGEVDNILFQGSMMKPKQMMSRSYTREDTGEVTSTSFDDSASLQVEVSGAEESGGGKMWQAAKEEAALNNDFQPRDASLRSELQPLSRSAQQHPTTPESKQSLRVEPTYSSYEGGYFGEENGWQDVGRKEVEAVGVGSEWKGFKRNRMTAMALLGIFGGLFPSLFVIMTCHFITGDVAVGQDQVEFALHYGLHKFAPIDSAFRNGECLAYEESAYGYSQPTVPLALSVAAAALSVLPLIVISAYLHFSMTHQVLWVSSMWMLYLAFICQISTLSMFLLNLCRNGVQCSMGPGSRAAVLSSVVWFVLSIEMKLNSPLIPAVDSEGVVLIERDNRVVSGTKKLWRRAKGQETPSLSRTAMKKQRGRIGETEITSYRPPDIV